MFKGRLLSETTAAEFEAVIPEVEGNAFVYGFANWIVDARDPPTHDFLVR